MHLSHNSHWPKKRFCVSYTQRRSWETVQTSNSVIDVRPFYPATTCRKSFHPIHSLTRHILTLHRVYSVGGSLVVDGLSFLIRFWESCWSRRTVRFEALNTRIYYTVWCSSFVARWPIFTLAIDQTCQNMHHNIPITTEWGWLCGTFVLF